MLFIVVEAEHKMGRSAVTYDGQTTRSSSHQQNQVSDWTLLLLSSLSYWSLHGDTLHAECEGSLCGAETLVG